MPIIVIIVLLVLLLGGGGTYYGQRSGWAALIMAADYSDSSC
jgi:hypothetical protein